ncbi:MAG: hypothetical protein GTO63_27660 [Anaerolineae bacterium]|nr:hypothetical protein [Anaerolineae bacterium]NIN98508.1 hypothetical protein [Anaerolineae bacterium]
MPRATRAGVFVRLDTRRLDQIAARMQTGPDEALDNLSHEAVEEGIKPRTPVRTGQLRDSYHVWPPEEPNKRIISDGPADRGRLYGIYQEFGFHHWRTGRPVPGQPHFLAGLHQVFVEPRIAAEIKEVVFTGGRAGAGRRVARPVPPIHTLTR